MEGFVSGGGCGAKKKPWIRNETPRRQWNLQERSELVEKMGEANRRRKMNRGWAASKAAAVA